MTPTSVFHLVAVLAQQDVDWNWQAEFEKVNRSVFYQ